MAKLDIRKIVTEKIIEGLEKGIVAWVRPWGDGVAVNHLTGKVYRGINQFILSFMADDKGWVNRWLTFKALAGKGWRVRKGEHGTQIAFFTFIEDEENDRRFPLLRYYTVFSISQLEDMPEYEPVTVKGEPNKLAEKLVTDMPNRPTIVEIEGHTRASYDPKTDEIKLPDRKQFTSMDEFYSTLFHEVAHSTGHASRLGRKGIVEFDRFGSEQYSLEELVAEFTSAFLCAETGIEKTVENSTAYIQNWLAQLRNDRQMLLTAASQAQKAADFVLNRKYEKDKEE